MVKEVEKVGKDAWTKSLVVFKREKTDVFSRVVLPPIKSNQRRAWGRVREEVIFQIPLASPPVDTKGNRETGLRSIIRHTISNRSLVCSRAAGAICVNTPKCRCYTPVAYAQATETSCCNTGLTGFLPRRANQLKHVQILSGVSGVGR